MKQAAGRSAGTQNGLVIYYADKVTDSRPQTVDETNRRRGKQRSYSRAHDITTRTAIKQASASVLGEWQQAPVVPYAYTDPEPSLVAEPVVSYMTRPQLEKAIERARRRMTEAARKLEFIEAAQYRDEMLKLQELLEAKPKDEKEAKR